MIKIPAKIPFSPSRLPFFYGWVILFAGIIGVLMSIPGQTMGVSVFTDHLIRDLELSRIQLSLSYLIGTVMSGFLITYAGILYDKAGARVISIGAGLMLGGVLVYLTRVNAMADSLAGIFAFAGEEKIKIGLVIIGFFGIRFFGQGVLTMVSRNMVMKWFDKRRGFANGILGVFTAFGFSYSPRILQSIIQDKGWIDTWLIIALVVSVFFTLFAFIFFRDNPTDAGQIPDGMIIPEKLSGVKSTSSIDFDLKDVVKSFSFWIFTLNIGLTALYFTAFTFHIESIFTTAGLDSKTAFSVFLPGSIIAAIVHISGSWLSDYIRLKYILIFSYLGIILSLSGVLLIKSSLGVWPFIVGNGIITGTYNILIAITWPRFYGLKNLGKISGFVISFGVISSALGPFLFSLSERIFLSYTPAVLLVMLVTIVLLILSFWANNKNDNGYSAPKTV
ncbi:MAG: MFS transporter [Bacteroidales bacterium]|nr:MFS transporter [Bacteroidales bacterium]MCF8405954.1 MFS transporter [Bacteroidales bacterium]